MTHCLEKDERDHKAIHRTAGEAKGFLFLIQLRCLSRIYNRSPCNQQ